MAPEPRFFNCGNCPAYCCTYDHIETRPADLERLSKYFGIPVETVKRRYTKLVDGGKMRVLRHQKDEMFGTACQFLDLGTRRCTIYEGRPRICREYPGTVRCGFYDFLMAERRAQRDPEHVPNFTRG